MAESIASIKNKLASLEANLLAAKVGLRGEPRDSNLYNEYKALIPKRDAEIAGLKSQLKKLEATSTATKSKEKAASEVRKSKEKAASDNEARLNDIATLEEEKKTLEDLNEDTTKISNRIADLKLNKPKVDTKVESNPGEEPNNKALTGLDRVKARGSRVAGEPARTSTTIDTLRITTENLPNFIAKLRENKAQQEDIRLKLLDSGIITKAQAKIFSEWQPYVGAVFSDAIALGMSFEDYITWKTETVGSNGSSGGSKTNSETFQEFSNDNNLRLDQRAIDNYTNLVNSGTKTVDDIKLELRTTMIAPNYPAWAEQIKAGTNLSTLAYPYMAQAAKTLEIPISSLSLDDPRIRKAMQSVDSKGQPSYMPLWQFEKEVLQKDPSWQYTQNGWTDAEDKYGKVLGIMGIGNVPGFANAGDARKLGAQKFYTRMIGSLGGSGLDANTIKAVDDAPNSNVALEALRESKWYKDSFPAMEKFRVNNPNASELSYKTQEANYKSILRKNDFPFGFYDTPAKIASLMERDIDVAKFKSIVATAIDLANMQDPETLATLKEYHPALSSKGAIASYFLDEKQSLEALQNLVTEVSLGGLSRKSGSGISRDYASQLATQIGSGAINPGKVTSAIEDSGEKEAGTKNLADLEGGTLTFNEIVKGTLNKATAEGKRLSGLRSKQVALFGGSGAGTISLGKETDGSF